ncbi:unnamed protein product, partial [Polarella glacialis]
HGKAFAMHKLTDYAKKKRGLLENEAPQAVPERTEEELRQTATILDDTLIAYWARRGIHVKATEKWARFFKESDTDRDGRLSFKELEGQLSARLKGDRKGHVGSLSVAGYMSSAEAEASVSGANSPRKSSQGMSRDDTVIQGVSHDDLYALWTHVDDNASGTVTNAEWQIGIYRLRLATWPTMGQEELGKAVDTISKAASKWIGPAKNWYKVFNLVDVDGSGSIGHDEFFEIIRRPLPCLAISHNELPNTLLKALWKAMDTDASSRITVPEFMLFMRRLEVRRNNGSWRPQQARGSIVAKAQMAKKLADEAKAPRTINPEQETALKVALRDCTDQAFANAYASWNLPWVGSIGEWEWHRVVRDFLGLGEETLDDDDVHAVWSSLDRGNLGEVPVSDLLALARS